MKNVRVNITVPQATASDLQAVKKSLVRQGVKVDSVLDAICVITGEIAQSKLSSLDPGTGATVELDLSVQLPPSDSPIQ